MLNYISKSIQMIDCAINFVKMEDNFSLLNKKSKKYSKYKWTADISNLVELAYAILEAECVNNGDAEIMAFVEFLGEMFNIKIGRCSDFYYKMRTKSGSRTAFLQKLTKALEARMDRDDEKRSN